MRDRSSLTFRPLLLSWLCLTVGCSDGSFPRLEPEWGLEPELRIGSLDDPDQTLTFVTALTLGPAGEVYLSQPQEQCIKVFSSSGEYLRTIGREGEGPGEFMGLGEMGWLEGTLYVSDFQNRRVSFFEPNGSYLRSVSNAWPVIDEVFSPVLVSRFLADGKVLVLPGLPSRAVADGLVAAHPLFRMDTTGHVLQTVAEMSVENSKIAVKAGRGNMYTDQPFSDSPLLGISPSGDFVVTLDRRASANGDQGVMSFTKISSGGDTVLSKEIHYDPVPFHMPLLDEFLDSRASARASMFGSAAEARQALEEKVFRPAFFPPATQLVVADEDWVFVRREALPGPEVLWEILSGDGEHVGSVSLPAPAQVFRATDTHLWVTEMDELGVTYVVRYQIMKT